MDLYLTIKTIHIISATILFGTGAGIAFFMFCSRFTNDIQQKYYAVKFTVIADCVFTLPAVILQPLSGFWLIYHGGFDPMDFWLTTTYGLYALAGLCWLPVVWIQIKLRNILIEHLNKETELPQTYYKLFNIWFLLGWPAFIGLIIIFYLMVAKPI